jgi:hypothetical protein
MNDELRKKTQETADRLFGKGIKMDPPYLMWKEFDRDLANDLSLFITGKLYSRAADPPMSQPTLPIALVSLTQKSISSSFSNSGEGWPNSVHLRSR